MSEETQEKKTRLKPTQWAELVALYESGEFTQAELAERYGISEPAVQLGLKRAKAVKGKYAKEHAERAKDAITAVAAKAVMSQATIEKRILETREQHYTSGEALYKLMMKEIFTNQQAGRPFAALSETMRTFKDAGTALKLIREERFAALGIKAEEGMVTDEVEALVIQQMTAEEVVRQRALVSKQDMIDNGLLTDDELEELDASISQGESVTDDFSDEDWLDDEEVE